MSKPKVIEADNLSQAWAKTFLVAMETSSKPLLNLTVGFPVHKHEEAMRMSGLNETEAIRRILNQQLIKLKKPLIDTVAGTIFPISMWNPSDSSAILYERYKRIWSRVRKCRPNVNGTYFQRMIAYGWENNKSDELMGYNQLQSVINTYLGGNHRHSALCAAIRNPPRDHSDQRQLGFPCLQHVHFVVGENNTNLTVTGIYANQLLLEKAYGNYLGLYRLGLFMAQQMGLELVRVQVNASRAMGTATTKEQLKGICKELASLVPNNAVGAEYD